jgi:hypothetical protein
MLLSARSGSYSQKLVWRRNCEYLVRGSCLVSVDAWLGMFHMTEPGAWLIAGVLFAFVGYDIRLILLRWTSVDLDIIIFSPLSRSGTLSNLTDLDCDGESYAGGQNGRSCWLSRGAGDLVPSIEQLNLCVSRFSQFTIVYNLDDPSCIHRGCYHSRLIWDSQCVIFSEFHRKTQKTTLH